MKRLFLVLFVLILSITGAIYHIQGTNTAETISAPQLDPLNDWQSINISYLTYLENNILDVNIPGQIITDVFQIGDKIKAIQSDSPDPKFFYIVGILDTRIILDAGDNYLLTNAPLFEFYTSSLSSPVGHPGTFSFTPTVMTLEAGGVELTNWDSKDGKRLYYDMQDNVIRMTWIFFTTDFPESVTLFRANFPFVKPIQVINNVTNSYDLRTWAENPTGNATPVSTVSTTDRVLIMTERPQFTEFAPGKFDLTFTHLLIAGQPETIPLP